MKSRQGNLPDSYVPTPSHPCLLRFPVTIRSAALKEGYAIHMYACSESMVDSCLSNADGDFLIVPQEGGSRA